MIAHAKAADRVAIHVRDNRPCHAGVPVVADLDPRERLRKRVGKRLAEELLESQAINLRKESATVDVLIACDLTATRTRFRSSQR